MKKQSGTKWTLQRSDRSHFFKLR